MIGAAEYLRAGFGLVPIPLGKKGPAKSGWNRRENAITSKVQLSQIKGNVGLAHAYCSPTPTMALDVDDLEFAHSWLAVHQVCLGSLLDAANAVQIVSGKAGKAKLVYRLPSRELPIVTLQIANIFSGCMGLEFRCATAGGFTQQDVLPPSVHPDTGQPYQWGGQGDWRRLPTIPDRLLEVWKSELQSRSNAKKIRTNTSYGSSSFADSPRQRAVLDDLLRHISADCSYEFYRDIVWAIMSLGWQDSEELAERWCRTAPQRFEGASFQAVVNSHDNYRSPTIGTIIYYARTGGWNG